MEEGYGEVGSKTVFARGGVIKGSATGINAASKNKEGAWEFLRFLVSREWQMSQIDDRVSVPVLKEAAEERFARQYADLEGHHYRQGVLSARKDFYLEMMGDILKYGKPIEMKIDYDAWNIVSEEVEGYYSGQRPLEVVLDVIKNRLRLYLSEQK